MGPAKSDRADPGKQTLVEQLEVPAVQWHAAAGNVARDEASVRAAASHGIATPASPLPYADRLQRLFGRHDISAVQAHTGGAAAASASTMGADAYATGNHVVLGGGTDLHTVAHEAAHVVQQRGGVQLKGGVGAAGDAYEHHADAVADPVVSDQVSARWGDDPAKPAQHGFRLEHQLRPTVMPRPFQPIRDRLAWTDDGRIFGPAASKRKQLRRLVPVAHSEVSRCPDKTTTVPSQPPSLWPARRVPWAELLKRVFADDVLNCVCGGRRTVVAVVTDAGTARSLLDGLGLPHRPPVGMPRGPPDLFDDPSPAFEADPPAPDE